jgi:hypothetical protein
LLSLCDRSSRQKVRQRDPGVAELPPYDSTDADVLPRGVAPD